MVIKCNGKEIEVTSIEQTSTGYAIRRDSPLTRDDLRALTEGL